MKTMHGDNEFIPLKDLLNKNGIILEACDTDQHMPQIERINRFFKERIQSIRMDIPFKCLPK